MQLLRYLFPRPWPEAEANSRETLVQFGQAHCKIDRPAPIIDEILETAASYAPNMEPGAIWASMRKQIEAAIFSIAGPRVHAVAGPGMPAAAIEDQDRPKP